MIVITLLAWIVVEAGVIYYAGKVGDYLYAKGDKERE